MDPYNEAHLYVAAIRILQHREGGPPSLEDLCAMVGVSVELGTTVCRNLEKLGIVSMLSDPFSLRLSIADHLLIEKLPKKAAQENLLARELERFQAQKQDVGKKAAAIQAELSKKKHDLFADIEARLKKELGKK
jgi:hypothetical protein